MAENSRSADRILLVEDNEINQELMKIILEKSGYRIRMAANGQEAIDAFREERDFSLILIDVHMPVLDGLEATRAIRNIEKEEGLTRRIPIIALSAGVVDKERAGCLDAGCDEFISKPIRKEALLEILNKFR